MPKTNSSSRHFAGSLSYDRNGYLIKGISIVIEVLLIIGIIAYLFYTMVSMYGNIGNLSMFAETAILNSLVTIAIIEVYLGVGNYLKGASHSMDYIIDAAISFVVREIIIEIFGKTYTAYTLVAFGVLVLILVISKRILAFETPPQE